MLGGVDTGSQWSSPGRRVDGGAFVLCTRDRLPVNEECDCVFGLRYTVVGCACGYPCGGARNHACGNGLVLQDPTTYIDMVGR